MRVILQGFLLPLCQCVIILKHASIKQRNTSKFFKHPHIPRYNPLIMRYDALIILNDARMLEKQERITLNDERMIERQERITLNNERMIEKH